jgi:hypothetical protein
MDTAINTRLGEDATAYRQRIIDLTTRREDIGSEGNVIARVMVCGPDVSNDSQRLECQPAPLVAQGIEVVRLQSTPGLGSPKGRRAGVHRLT